MSVTIVFGPGNSIQQPLNKYPTLASVQSDANLRAILGFSPDAVTAQVNGIPADRAAMLRDGDTVSFHTKAHSKAGK